MNAIDVGWLKPLETVVTVKFASSMAGETAAAWIGVVVDAELLLKSKSVSFPVTVAVLLICSADGITTMVIIELAPTARLPTLQFTVLVPLQLP